MRAAPASSRVATALAVSLLSLATAPAQAAGFQLNETSASGLGLAYAGGAAWAEDASTLWSNAAGIARVRERQLVGVVHLITPSIKFGNGASVAASQQALGGPGGDAGGLNVVPNLYFAMPLGPAWSVGLGVNAPWGLVTEYDGGWIGRFQALKSSIQTINLNPTVAFKASPQLSLGFGLNVQRMMAEFTNRVNYSGALLSAAAANGILPGTATFNAIAAATPGLESSARISGDDNGTGWNLGLLWSPAQDTRLGLQYRSAVTYHLTGSAQFANPAPSVAGLPAPLAGTINALAAGVNAAALNNSGIVADVKIPPVANVSVFHRLDSRFDLMADAQWTGWSTIRTLTFTRSDGKLLQSTPENFKDVWKLSLGVNWRPGGDWTWRGGLAVDDSPVQTADRTARLPDAGRTWLTVGGQYKARDDLRFDWGAAYIWVKSADITNNGNPGSTAGNGLLSGRYRSHTTVLSGQFAYSF